jgi:hypothetical protein
VAVPYHQVKNYCFPELFDCLNSLTYENKEIVMRWDPCEYGSQDAVKKQREFFRQLALDKGFDYLYFLGADTLPPANALEVLVEKSQSKNLGIVGGVYWGRHNAANGRPDCAVAWVNSLTQKQQADLFIQPDQLLKIDGMGMDCVLIRRDVLEKVSWLDWEQNDDDYPFYDLAKAKGFPCYIDTSVQCEHYFAAGLCVYKAEVVEN